MKQFLLTTLSVFHLISFSHATLWGPEGDSLAAAQQSGGNTGRNTSAGSFRIVILRGEARLSLYEGDRLVKTYAVAVGNAELGKSTPAGRFKIVSKVKDPIMVWRSGKVIPANDPRNSYGPRWIGLADYATGRYRGCGIQGTNVESSVGRQITVGCVRMHNDDIIELFDVVGVGTEVIIR